MEIWDESDTPFPMVLTITWGKPDERETYTAWFYNLASYLVYWERVKRGSGVEWRPN